jgi:transposase
MPRRPRPIRAWQLPEPTPPRGQAALLEASLDQELVRILGAIPLLLPLIEQLGVREIINRRCHPAETDTADLDLGLVTLVLILNRLLAPKPLVHVEEWLADTVLPDLLGIDAAQGNDDRLARALDALVPHLDALWQDLVVAAVVQFDLDLSQLCYDLTSISFCGDYEGAEGITFGYSRDHRPDRKQVELATTVTVAGGVPLDYRLLAGGRPLGRMADRTTPIENLARLQGLLARLPPRDPNEHTVVVSDRAMLTLEALAAYDDSDLCYLGPLDPALGQGAVRELLAAVPAAALAELAYRPHRAAHDPDWDAYRGALRTLELSHPEPERAPLQVRALVVWSPAKARLDQQLRITQLERLEATLADLAGKLGKRPYTTRSSVEKRVATILRRHPARRLVAIQVGGDGKEDPVALTWTRQEDVIATAAQLDGRYVLGTNDPSLDADQMLSRSKRRDVPEKRYALIKGPLAVRPVYLHKEERVHALVFCTMVALLVFALLELLACRAGLSQSGQTLVEAFASLAVVALVFADGSTLRRLSGLSPPLAAILQELGLPPAQRYVTVHP